MSKSVNTVYLLGNIGNDPVVKYAPSGTAISNFSVATTESRKNRDEEWVENTEWHKIVAFGRTAEVIKDYLHKGSKVHITGRLQTRSWEDQSGKKNYMTEVVVDNIVMLDGKRGENGAANHVKSQDSQHGGYTSDDDLPF